MAHREDPDDMQQNVAIRRVLHSLLVFKQPTGTEKYYNLEIEPVTPVNTKRENPILIV